MLRTTLSRLCALTLTLLAALAVGAAAAPAAPLPADDSFGAGGSVIAPLGAGVRPMEDPVTIEAPDGDIVTAVVTDDFIFNGDDDGLTPPGLVVFRHYPWGAPDQSFGTGGAVRVAGVEGDVSDLRALADGSVQILVEGWGSESPGRLLHLSPSGAVTQRTFTKQDAGAECWGMLGGALRADGSAVVAFSCPAGYVLLAIPLSGAASPITLSAAPQGGLPQDVAVDASGRFIVAFVDWSADPDVTHVRRYSAAGVHDQTFASDGDASFTGGFESLLLDPLGRVVVGTYVWGSTTAHDWNIHRLDGDGDADDTFGGDGHVLLSDDRLGVSGPTSLRPDGKKLLITGLLGTGSGNGTVVVRLLADGKPDESFGSGGITELDPERRPWARSAATAQADGNVLLTFGFADDLGEERPLRVAVAAAAKPGPELMIMRFGTARRERPSTGSQGEQQAPAAPVVTTQTSRAARLSRTCRSRRLFTIRLRSRGLRSATVRVAGRRVTVRRQRGRLTATVDLRRLHQATFQVSVVAIDARGRRHRETRSYRTCRVGAGGRKVQSGSTFVTVD